MISNFLNQGANFAKKVVGKAGAVTGIAQAVGNRLAAAGLPLGGIFGRTESALPQQFATPAEQTDWAVSLSCPQYDNLMGDSEVLKVLGNNTFKGIRWPTTPSVFVSHSASYDSRAVIHNNYPYYAYQNSRVDSMLINGSFPVMTAEDGRHWLATIHFLRTVTKMYYGQGTNVGNPPPICKLNGYGNYVFQNVPVIITNFTVDLRADVDYIGVSVEDTQTQNLIPGGTMQIEGVSTLVGGGSNSSFNKTKTYSPVNQQVKVGSINYVPTDSMVTVNITPIYSRNKISKFNLKSFAAGDLASKGFI